jgi:hypothetical protein
VTAPFAVLAALATVDPDRRRRIAAHGRTIDDALALAVLRAARGKTPEELVRRLAVWPAAAAGSAPVALYRATLRQYIVALVGAQVAAGLPEPPSPN